MGMLFRGVALAAIVTVASWAPSPFSSAPKTAQAGARCSPTISCGSGCVARLSSGFCMHVGSTDIQGGIGPFKLGPKFKAGCTLCECWYVYQSRDGNRRFKRTTRMRCEVGAGGITTYGPMAVD